MERKTVTPASKSRPVDNFGGNPDFLPSYCLFFLNKTKNKPKRLISSVCFLVKEKFWLEY